MGSVGEWQTLAQKCVDIQQKSIPKQWLVPSEPSATQITARGRRYTEDYWLTDRARA